MKITAVILLYALFLTGDRGQARLKMQLWVLVPFFLICLALALGLEVPTMNEITGGWMR